MRKTRHVRPALFRSASAGLLAAVVAALFATSTVRAAPGPLVIDGETIGDAALIGDAQKEGKLTVYSASPIAYEKQLLARFTADTGIPGEAIRLTSELLYQRVTSEAAGHRLGADFVDLSDPTLENQLADTGILRAYRVPNFNAVPGVLKDPRGRWYAISRLAIGIAVNSALVKPADMPARWSDLLDPKWKGKIGFASIEAGGTSFTPFLLVHQKYGADFWKKLAAQNPRIYATAAPVVADLMRGEISVAINPNTSAIDQIEAGAPMKFVFPADGIPSPPEMGGIAATAPHARAAQLYLNWLTSKRARKRSPRSANIRSYRASRPRAPACRSRRHRNSPTCPSPIGRNCARRSVPNGTQPSDRVS
jgi:iron(III) transport system substrate-binding protein